MAWERKTVDAILKAAHEDGTATPSERRRLRNLVMRGIPYDRRMIKLCDAARLLALTPKSLALYVRKNGFPAKYNSLGCLKYVSEEAVERYLSTEKCDLKCAITKRLKTA